jgi:hypothetical protein
MDRVRAYLRYAMAWRWPAFLHPADLPPGS